MIWHVLLYLHNSLRATVTRQCLQFDKILKARTTKPEYIFMYGLDFKCNKSDRYN